MPIKNTKRLLIIGLIVIVSGFLIWYLASIFLNRIEYTNIKDTSLNGEKVESNKAQNIIPNLPNTLVEIPVTHIQTPEYVRSIYLSSWTAGAKKYLDPLVHLVDTTELNAMVIDVKDSTGRIGFNVSDPELQKYGSVEKRIPDVRALTTLLHQKNIYIIGRVAVFQDPFMTKLKPEWSITRKSDGKVWKDRKGLSFLDPANIEVRKYVVAVALEAYKQGFDEINLI